jgi:hypothetical protein
MKLKITVVAGKVKRSFTTVRDARKFVRAVRKNGRLAVKVA